MPWSLWLIGGLLLLIVLPPFGDYVAVLVVFGSSLVLAGFAKNMDAKTYEWLLSPEGLIAAALVAGATALAISFMLLVRWSRPSATPHQQALYANSLILLWGIPLVVGVAFWRLFSRWPSS